MSELLEIIKDFDLERYETLLSNNIDVNHLNWKLEAIYSEDWCESSSTIVPMEVITHLADSYQFIPKRPDIAFNMCWKALNNSFNQMILVDNNMNRLEDQKGIDKLIEMVRNDSTGKYQSILGPFYAKIPMKATRFFANYILKSYIVDRNGESGKFYYSMYTNFKKNNKPLYDLIINSYGASYAKICNLVITDGKLNYNISDDDEKKSHNIVRSLSQKINDLVRDKIVGFQDRSNTNLGQIKFNEIDKLNFILRYITYATRCSNFHGNVSVRLATNYSNKESYLLSRYIYNFTHLLLAISLHANGHINDDDLDRISVNTNFL